MLVIDEAQDMADDEYALVTALMTRNEEMRVIAVGDDDQNIYEFRGSDSDYMFQLAQRPEARFIEMTDNFRSARHPVTFDNEFVRSIPKRMKHTPIKSMRSEEGGSASLTTRRRSCISRWSTSCAAIAMRAPRVSLPRRMRRRSS